MANEIVKLVAKKAGISEPIAQIAVDTMLSFAKTKVPANMGGMLDAVMGSGSSSSSKGSDPLGGLGNVIGGLGGLLGKK